MKNTSKMDVLIVITKKSISRLSTYFYACVWCVCVCACVRVVCVRCGVVWCVWRYVILRKPGQHVNEMMAVAVKNFQNF